MTAFVRRLQRTRNPTLTTPGGAITHGQELTIAMTGPSSLGVSAGNLTPAGDPSTRLSNWPGNSTPAWIVETPYVYNNNPTNKGGVVPAGGMMIDGFMVPAGTYVVQFRDFSGQQIVVEGDVGGAYPPFYGLMLRGCKWRGSSSYVGLISENGTSCGGKLWIHYCDLGGLSSQPADYCEIPLKSAIQMRRVTEITSLMQPRVSSLLAYLELTLLKTILNGLQLLTQMAHI